MSDEQRITAVDLMVEFVPRGGRDRKRGDALPAFLRPQDFEIRYDGEPVRMIAVDVDAPAQYAPSREPWTIVLYFDLRLTSPVEVGWAATELGARAESLTALGQVAVALADPFPRQVISPTRDPDLLQAGLAELALFPEGGEHELLSLRDELLAELADPTSTLDHAELLAFTVAEEKRIVERQHDALLTFLADQVEADGSLHGARRALFLASAGFDLRPEDFYQPHLARLDKSARSFDEAWDLSAGLETLARTLAAYGWITFPLAPPPPPPPPTGIRVGKWLVGRPKIEYQEPPPDVSGDPFREAGRPLINLLRAKREDHRDPERAESFRELGTSLAAEGDLKRAEKAFRMALYHFADDPRNTDEQAATWAQLGEVLTAQGRRRESREVFKKARQLDPESAVVDVGPVSELLAPLTPLERLARGTTGGVLRDPMALSRALAGLIRRVRLSYQVAGLPDGKLHAVEVRCRRGKWQLSAPHWARSATPETVASARLRRWLVDDAFAGDLEVSAKLLAPSGAGGARPLTAELMLPAEPALDVAAANARLRFTLGFGDPRAAVTVRHETWPVPERTAWETWAYRRQVVLPVGDAGITLLVEHLDSDRWGVTWVRSPGAGSEP